MMSVLLFLAIAPYVLHSQQSVQGGTIAGDVFCTDTHSPARFAKVLLKRLAEDGRPDQEAALPGAVTDLNGMFRIEGVTPGEYLIYGVLPGYVDESNTARPSTVDSNKASGDSDGPSVVHVTRGRSVESHLALARGSSLSGNVLYGDGTPVQDATVKVLRGKGANGAMPRKAEEIPGLSPFLFDNPGQTTDDRGHFRIAGLPEGDYSLEVLLRSPKSISYRDPNSFVDDSGTQFMLNVFLGDSLEWNRASVIHVDAAEDRSGIEIRVPLEQFRTFTGSIVSALDQHAIHHATVLLHSSGDPSFERRASLQTGHFEFDLIPAGNYVLTISDARDVNESVIVVGSQHLVERSTAAEYERVRRPIDLSNDDLVDMVFALKPRQ